MTHARIEFDTRAHDDDDEQVRFRVIGGNGEVQAVSEWYDNQSNATRGVTDLFNTLASIGMTREPEDLQAPSAFDDEPAA